MNSVDRPINASGNTCSASYLPSSFSVTTAGSKTFTITTIDRNGNSTVSSSRTIDWLAVPGGGTGGGATTRVDQSSNIPGDGTTSVVTGIGQRFSNFFANLRNAFSNFFNMFRR